MSREAWIKFLQGDESSFPDIYHAYFGELFAYALKIGFDEETSKDAIQDVFFKIYVSKSKLTHIQNIEYYLLHALKNRLFDIYNLENRIHNLNYHDLFIENENSIAEQIIIREKQTQMESEVAHLLQSLPSKQRKIIHYHFQLNLSFSEIGELLHISPETVRKSVYRAIKKLKEKASHTL